MPTALVNSVLAMLSGGSEDEERFTERTPLSASVLASDEDGLEDHVQDVEMAVPPHGAPPRPKSPLSPSISSPTFSVRRCLERPDVLRSASVPHRVRHPKFPCGDDLKIAVGRMKHGCSLQAKKPKHRSFIRSNSTRERHAESVRGEVEAFKPLRKTRSLLAGLEDDTTSHEHTVVQPKQTVTVSSFAQASLRLSKLEALSALGLMLVASTAFYTLCAEWSLLDALYFSIVTLTTVGYGDVVPKDTTGRIFALVLFFLGAGVVGSLIGTAFTDYLDDPNETQAQKKSKSEARERLNERRALHPWRRLSRSLALVAIWTVVGALVFTYFEPKYSFVDACYWAGASLTTVGYGDIRPTTPVAKLFVCFYVLGGTYVCLKALGSIAAIPIEAHRLQLEAVVLSQYGDKLTQADFLELTRGDLVKRLGLIDDERCHRLLSPQSSNLSPPKPLARHGDSSPPGTRTNSDRGLFSRRITKTAFALAMLVKLGKIDIDDVEDCLDQFKRLDHHDNGYLEFDDVTTDSSPEPPNHSRPKSVSPPPHNRRALDPKKKHKRHIDFDADEPAIKGNLRRAALAAKDACRLRRNSLVTPVLTANDPR